MLDLSDSSAILTLKQYAKNHSCLRVLVFVLGTLADTVDWVIVTASVVVNASFSLESLKEYIEQKERENND
jgi:hypothetical protein